MQNFEIILVLLLGAALLSLAAGRLKVPYPVFLALLGAAIAVIPGIPVFSLSSELILALLVAPVLLDAAHDISFRDLRRNKLPILSLVVVAVGLTCIAVTFIAKAFFPDMPWAAAIALGALLAPTDAVAAIAVMRQIELPHRIKVILEGESLFNDASSLLIYGLAVQTLVTGSFHVADALTAFLLVAVGSVCAGWILAKVIVRLLQQIQDPATSTVLQFVTIFGVWVLAEHLHLSGVITVVCYGLTAARAPSSSMSARVRIISFAIWETVTFVLNILAFVLVGLQLRDILPLIRPEWVGIAFISLTAVILVRVLWVFLYHFLYVRGLIRPAPGVSLGRDDLKEGIVVGWSGMRGIVTLAAALALPDRFPYRNFILLVAFVVVLGTLLLQGLTLRLLLRLLNLPYDDQSEAETKLARAYVFGIMRTDAPSISDSKSMTPDKNILLARETLDDLRKSEKIGDGVYRKIEQEIDWLDLSNRK